MVVGLPEELAHGGRPRGRVIEDGAASYRLVSVLNRTINLDA
jgi:hypothetical protein